MKKQILGATLGLALFASPLSAYADQTALEANQLAAVQALDVLTTAPGTGFMGRPGYFERDPVFRPYTHNVFSLTLASALVNFGLRTVFRHAPKVIRYIKFGDAAAVTNNFVELSK